MVNQAYDLLHCIPKIKLPNVLVFSFNLHYMKKLCFAVRGREDLIRSALKGSSVTDIDFSAVAELLSGFSCADVLNVCR
jgi:hypothetical protein